MKQFYEDSYNQNRLLDVLNGTENKSNPIHLPVLNVFLKEIIIKTEHVNKRNGKVNRNDSLNKLSKQDVNTYNIEDLKLYMVNFLKRIVEIENIINFLIGILGIIIAVSVLTTPFGLIYKNNENLYLVICFLSGAGFIFSAFKVYRQKITKICMDNFLYEPEPITLSVCLLTLNSIIVFIHTLMTIDVDYMSLNTILTNYDFRRIGAILLGLGVYALVELYMLRKVNIIKKIDKKIAGYNPVKLAKATKPNTAKVVQFKTVRRGCVEEKVRDRTKVRNPALEEQIEGLVRRGRN